MPFTVNTEKMQKKNEWEANFMTSVEWWNFGGILGFFYFLNCNIQPSHLQDCKKNEITTIF